MTRPARPSTRPGKILGLAYPGGRLLDTLARRGRADAKLFPRPYLDNDNLDFSFSGLKTAVSLYVKEHFADEPWPHPLQNPDDAPQGLCDLCASFNLAVVDTLLAKVRRAMKRYPGVRNLIMAGGVAANSLLRERVTELMEIAGGKAFMPPLSLCTDNAAMIAYAGWLYASEGFCHDLSMETIPRGRPIPDDYLPRPALIRLALTRQGAYLFTKSEKIPTVRGPPWKRRTIWLNKLAIPLSRLLS